MSDDPNLPPYAFVAKPAITLVLLALAERCQVGQTIRPGNRTIAQWAERGSSSEIPAILDRLATDGWIAYDGHGAITLLRDPRPWPGDPQLHADDIPGYLLSLPRQK